MMSDAVNDEVLAWLHYAVKIEEAGLEFYKKCMDKISEQRAKELFKFLVEAEEGHKKALTELMLKKAGGDESRVKAALEKFNKLEQTEPMFSQEQFDKMTGKETLVMDMFNMAAAMEKNGINIYLDLEKKYEDPDVKAMFHDLAKQELIHKKQIEGVSASLLGLGDTEEEDDSPEALEKELAAQEEIIKEFTIKAENGGFTPKEIKVNKGETILLHVKAVDAPVGFLSVNFTINEYIGKGDEAEFKMLATTAGKFNFISNVPCPGGNENMKGWIIVEGENEPDEDII